jgi:hypothetical protein
MSGNLSQVRYNIKRGFQAGALGVWNSMGKIESRSSTTLWGPDRGRKARTAEQQQPDKARGEQMTEKTHKRSGIRVFCSHNDQNTYFREGHLETQMQGEAGLDGALVASPAQSIR